MLNRHDHSGHSCTCSHCCGCAGHLRCVDCCCKYDCGHGVGPFFGRLLISLLFLLSAIGQIIDYQGTVNAFTQLGIPGADAYIVIGVILQLVGSLLVLLGWYTRVGIWMLFIFLVPATLLFHGFWNYHGGEAIFQASLFLRNVAIFGGLVLLYSFGPGRWSLDAKKYWHHHQHCCDNNRPNTPPPVR